MMNRKSNGYALPLALIFVAIFSIIVANIGPRSNLNNQTTLNAINYFRAKVFLMDYISTKTCPTNINYLIVCNSTIDQVSVTITSVGSTSSITSTYP